MREQLTTGGNVGNTTAGLLCTAESMYFIIASYGNDISRRINVMKIYY